MLLSIFKVFGDKEGVPLMTKFQSQIAYEQSSVYKYSGFL